MNIMWNSDRIIGYSAYSKITHRSCTGLAGMGHNVAHIPMTNANKMGVWTYEGVRVYPSGESPWNEDVAVGHYYDFRADMLVVLKDIWVLGSLHNEAINFVPYVEVDHSPVSSAITQRLQTAFKVLVPSRFAQRELKGAGISENVHYIPHGVSGDYRPLDRAECKRAFYLDPDEFVVLVVAMNRVRKMIPRQLRIYKRFRELNPDVKGHLFLWTNVQPEVSPEGAVTMGVSDAGVNLLPEIMELGMGEMVRFPAVDDYRRGLPESAEEGQDMVKLYNAADVVLLCSGGEGAGMPLLEGAACGVPGVTTDYAAGPEYVGPGLTVPWREYDIINTPGTRFAMADVDRGAEALTRILNADREKLSRKCRAFAERYAWERIMQDYWRPFLDSCEVELRPRITGEGVRTWA